MDPDLNVVGLIDWDRMSTVPFIGYEPLCFCLAVEGYEERYLHFLSEWDRSRSDGESIAGKYRSDEVVTC